MKEKIIGFLILRKPKSMANVEPFNKIFKIGGKYYSGIDRSHLNDLKVEFYKKNLPVEISGIVKRIFEESNYLFFPREFIRDFNVALKLFTYVNKNLNELTVISSTRIMEKIGFTKIDSNLITWLGYDLTILQGGSLVFMGIFFKPHLFEKWIDRINDNGLLDSLEDCADYFIDYLKAAKNGDVEDYLVTEENSEPIRVGRIAL